MYLMETVLAEEKNPSNAMFLKHLPTLELHMGDLLIQEDPTMAIMKR